jgi:hypothetical protein
MVTNRNRFVKGVAELKMVFKGWEEEGSAHLQSRVIRGMIDTILEASAIAESVVQFQIDIVRITEGTYTKGLHFGNSTLDEQKRGGLWRRIDVPIREEILIAVRNKYPGVGAGIVGAKRPWVGPSEPVHAAKSMRTDPQAPLPGGQYDLDNIVGRDEDDDPLGSFDANVFDPILQGDQASQPRGSPRGQAQSFVPAPSLPEDQSFPSLDEPPHSGPALAGTVEGGPAPQGSNGLGTGEAGWSGWVVDRSPPVDIAAHIMGQALS